MSYIEDENDISVDYELMCEEHEHVEKMLDDICLEIQKIVENISQINVTIPVLEKTVQNAYKSFIDCVKTNKRNLDNLDFGLSVPSINSSLYEGIENIPTPDETTVLMQKFAMSFAERTERTIYLLEEVNENLLNYTYGDKVDSIGLFWDQISYYAGQASWVVPAALNGIGRFAGLGYLLAYGLDVNNSKGSTLIGDMWGSESFVSFWQNVLSSTIAETSGWKAILENKNLFVNGASAVAVYTILLNSFDVFGKKGIEGTDVRDYNEIAYDTFAAGLSWAAFAAISAYNPTMWGAAAAVAVCIGLDKLTDYIKGQAFDYYIIDKIYYQTEVDENGNIIYHIVDGVPDNKDDYLVYEVPRNGTGDDGTWEDVYIMGKEGLSDLITVNGVTLTRKQYSELLIDYWEYLLPFECGNPSKEKLDIYNSYLNDIVTHDYSNDIHYDPNNPPGAEAVADYALYLSQENEEYFNAECGFVFLTTLTSNYGFNMYDYYKAHQ